MDYARIATLSRSRATIWYLRQVVSIGVPYVIIRVRGKLHRATPDLLAGPRTQSTTQGTLRMTAVTLIRDLRYALRSLRRSPGFAVVAIGTLALAIGANSAIFRVVDTVLLDPLPYSEPDRLVHIAGSAPGSDLPEEFGLSSEFYVQYREEANLLEDVAMYVWYTNTLRTDDRVERVWMSAATHSVFTTLGATPILGRLPVEEDEDRVTVLSHALWTNWFGADPNVLGRTFHISGANRTVIGVMGPDFWFPNDRVLLWIPFAIRTDEIVTGRFGLPFVARVSPDVDREAVVDQLGTLARRLPERFGGSANYARIIEQYRPIVRSLEEQIVGSVSNVLWVLLGAVGVVLLIACANVANLFMVRFEGRQRELALRQAIGATRGQLISAQMSEALVVAGLAGALALVLASVGVAVMVNAAPAEIPRLDQVGTSLSTLFFTFLASTFAAMLCGLIPSIRASMPNMVRLRDAGRGATRQRHWGRDALVVAQTALALVLLIGSGLLVRSFWKLSNVDPGYETKDIFTFQIAPEGEHLFDGPSYARFHTDFMERVAALPGVESVGIIENVPLNEGVQRLRFRTEEMGGDVEAGTLLGRTFTGGNYFGTMGIDLLRGRPFTTADHTSDFGNVVISQDAADLLWPAQDPVGRRLRSENSETWMTVVGVVEDVLQYGFRDEPNPTVYYPLVGPTPTSWVLSSPAYVVKTPRAGGIAPEIRSIVQEVAPTAPMYRMFTMESLAADSMNQLSFTMLTLGIASGLALVLGAIGLYGVLSYVVAERTKEIGLRMALGAEARLVQRMIVAQGARVAGIGVLIGAAAALVSTRVLGGLLFGIDAVDPRTFAGMSAAMILVALLASYLPARRASRMDPIDSLRTE
jgi:predicted permease